MGCVTQSAYLPPLHDPHGPQGGDGIGDVFGAGIGRGWRKKGRGGGGGVEGSMGRTHWGQEMCRGSMGGGVGGGGLREGAGRVHEDKPRALSEFTQLLDDALTRRPQEEQMMRQAGGGGRGGGDAAWRPSVSHNCRFHIW